MEDNRSFTLTCMFYDNQKQPRFDGGQVREHTEFVTRLLTR